jgi:hypothetical protein
MPEFDEIFKNAKKEINEMRMIDSEIQNALDRYHGRSFVLAVNGDGVYVFRIKSNGLDYKLNPKSLPQDMYAKMDIATARKLVYTQNLGILDIINIEYRNIGLQDINFIKQLFSKKSRSSPFI